jgi:ArsR family transcriptional regulator
LFKSYADPTRLRILSLLMHAGELCVGDIAQVLRLAQPTASRHLAYLRRGGLVSVRQLGLWVYYSVAEPAGGLDRLLAAGIGDRLREAPEIRADRARLAKVRAAGGCCGPAPPAQVPRQRRRRVR